MSTYKQFPRRELVRDWDKLLKCSREEIEELEKLWEEIDKENDDINREMFKKRNDQISEAANYMKELGIEVFKYRSKGFFKEKSGYLAWFNNNVKKVIEKKYPSYNGNKPRISMDSQEVDGIKIYNNQSPIGLLEFYDRAINQYKRGKKELDKNNKLLIKSIEYATKNGIDIEGLDTDDIIDVVEDVAKEIYLKEEVPEGTEVYLKSVCYECSTYIMGERRCSCGNRRVSIVVEGNVIDGFYHYPEGY